jgi:hypothetical protein
MIATAFTKAPPRKIKMIVTAFTKDPPGPPCNTALKDPPSCRTCVFQERGMCAAFATQNPVTGVVEPLEAVLVRMNEKLCGYEGRYYIEKTCLN